MQYHQVRILCALRDKIWKDDKNLSREAAMILARERMTRLGSGSRDLLDLKMVLHPRGRKRDSGCGSFEFSFARGCWITQGGIEGSFPP